MTTTITSRPESLRGRQGLTEQAGQAAIDQTCRRLRLPTIRAVVDDAVTAVGRAETLAKRAEEHGLRKAQHCGYSYYLDNPATDLWIPVKQMLEEGGIIDSRRER